MAGYGVAQDTAEVVAESTQRGIVLQSAHALGQMHPNELLHIIAIRRL